VGEYIFLIILYNHLVKKKMDEIFR